jgi:hypothetical protein
MTPRRRRKTSNTPGYLYVGATLLRDHPSSGPRPSASGNPQRALAVPRHDLPSRTLTGTLTHVTISP